MNRIVTCLLVYVALDRGGAPHAPSRWAWFSATTGVDTWHIQRGQADVIIADTTIQATLWDDADTTFARVSLQGSLRGNTVRAIVVVNESDAPKAHVAGKLETSCWKEGGGRQALILGGDLLAVGLVRELPKEGRCVRGA